MIRTASILAALSLAFAQPVLLACQCTGCIAGCAPSQNATSTHKSCCAGKLHEGGRSCCGAPAGQCPCGQSSQRTSSKPTSPDDQRGTSPLDGQTCLCSTQPHSAAISPSVVQVDHSAGVQYFLADNSLFAGNAPQIAASVGSLDHGPPARYGGLRVHAFLGVWLI